VGIGLAGAPGPVQAVLLAEGMRGGVGRGLRALAGVHTTFGLILLALALGLSLVPPGGLALRALKVVGGAFLIWLAVDGIRGPRRPMTGREGGRTLHPMARGSIAILLNPGGWLFLGAVAVPLFATAARRGGTAGAVLTALALLVGVFLGDLGIVLLAGAGLRRAGQRSAATVRLALAGLLGALGAWLVVTGVFG
jgi:threonine/homoserine/homoserine lactone efflux protein